MNGGRLEGLDALRGIAALCVLVYHAAGGEGSNAYLAVDFFFMLSGYVMARTYETRLEQGLPPRRFVLARVRRLWPTMFQASLIAVPWLLSWVPASAAWPIIAANLLLVPTLAQNRVFLLNGPAWSILFELVANVLHAALLCRISRRLLIVLLMPTTLMVGWLAAHFTMEMGSKPETFLAGVPRVLLSYGIGIVLWRSWRDVPAIRVSAPFTLLAMPLFFGLGALVAGESWQSDLLFVVVLCPLLIAGGLTIGRPHVVLAWVGTISFPLYAVHGPVLRTGQWLGVSMWLGAIVSLPLAWLLMHAARSFETLLFGPGRGAAGIEPELRPISSSAT